LTVYLNKSITIRGGYTQSNWTAPDPTNHPTTLDALGLGRVLVITGPLVATVEGLRLTGGDTENGGGDWVACGGISVITATVALNKNSILSNTRCGVFLFHSQATLSSNAVYSNADDGIIVYHSPAATLVNNTVAGNACSGDGGGINVYWSDNATLTSNVIDGNLCDGGMYSTGGGGVRVSGSSAVSVSGNTISRNQASFGGGIEIDSSDVLLSDNVIISNTSGYFGGGVYVHIGSHARLEDNFISGNQGDVGGGVALDSSSYAILEGNSISENTARQGGGISVDDRSRAMLSENLVQSNEGQVAAGVFVVGGEIVLTNTVIVDNRATSLGSGLFAWNSPVRSLHTTIARNSGGDGSGLRFEGGATAALTNTILVSQTLGITAAAGSTATLDGVLWFGNGANTAGAGTIAVTNEYTGDPAFAADGYHLTPASAALDRDVDAGVETDIDGQPRPFGPAPDLGADEGQPALAVSKEASAELARPGFPLTYTLHVTNTGFVDLNATITDTLPDQVTPSGVRTWTATVPAFGGVWTGQVVITVAPEANGLLTNQVEVTSAEGASGQFTQTTRVGHWYHFPVILRGR
jgi:uncharacterized repeat protein (TIGR01451 family)